ncbi:MAG TPA: hypothetical protein VGK45_08255 [Thermoanaerobaculia bacterium]
MRGPILLVLALTAMAVDTTGWKTYRDPGFGFTLRYPASLVILPEKPLPERRPPLLHRVAFLDRETAASDLATMQPPQLAVEIFAPTSGSLRAWLAANGRLPAGSGVTDLKLSGAREGVRVRDPHLSAPDEFFYYATERGVIALIPSGAEGPAMLETFRLGVGKAGK